METFIGILINKKIIKEVFNFCDINSTHLEYTSDLFEEHTECVGIFEGVRYFVYLNYDKYFYSNFTFEILTVKYNFDHIITELIKHSKSCNQNIESIHFIESTIHNKRIFKDSIYNSKGKLKHIFTNLIIGEFNSSRMLCCFDFNI